jgi:hypothetical protein
MLAQYGYFGVTGGEYRWNDGSVGVGEYERWHTNQPNTAADKYPKQDCVKVRPDTGLWQSVDCAKNTATDGFAFVCERLPTC